MLRLLVRLGLAAMAALNLWWGLWASLAPRLFFDGFPGFGHHWTAAYPPYNAHLVTDLGATFLTLGALLAVAAVVADRRVRWSVLAGVWLFNTLHLAFHAGHRGTMSIVDYRASVASLAAGAAAPLLLAALDALANRPQRSTPST
jgi:hypothetical protein